MMNRTEIQKFFLLENDPQLFEIALRPRSCGGGAKFEQLALYGDAVIDMHLLKYFIESESMENNGDITQRKSTIHKENIIKAFADDLGIPDILTIPNSTYQLQNKELAETVEALIGGAFKANGLEKCYPIICSFAIFAQKRQKTSQKQGEFDISQDYISKLLNLSNNSYFNPSGVPLSISDIEPTRIGGQDDLPIYQFEGDITFDRIKYKISGSKYNNKKLAKQNAAYRALCAIQSSNTDNPIFDNTSNSILASQEKTMHPTISIDNEELIFCKPAPQNESMEVNQKTGELLVDWVNRKAKKNVFGMFVLLSARLDAVSGASWLCDFSSGVLALIHLQLGEKEYFALGFGSSNSQARKAAGEDMLMKVNFIEWIEKHYPNHII